MIVLDWLHGSPRRFKTFIGNRISKILETVSPTQWRHVPSKDNPADCASRGLFPVELLCHDLWWEGPPWLKSNSISWPSITQESYDQLPEAREELKVMLSSVAADEESFIPFKRFSSFYKLVRVMAWVRRFLQNVNPK